MAGPVSETSIEAVGISASLVGGQLGQLRLPRSAVFVCPGKHRRAQADAPSPRRDPDALDLQPGRGMPSQPRDERQLHRADDLAVRTAHGNQELVRILADSDVTLMGVSFPQ